MRARLAACLLGVALAGGGMKQAGAGEWSGVAAVDFRLFTQSAFYPEQNDTSIEPSVMVQPEFRQEWNEGADRFTAVGFGRYDSIDNNRSHYDAREFNWLHKGKSWDLRAGVGKVFWGVTESRHLVDIVNQTDWVENINAEEKLGQPMVNLNINTAYGTLSLFELPFFRERTFPAPQARLRFSLPVDEYHPKYHGANQWHQDFAARWSRTFGGWDVGVSHFWGVGREPFLTPYFPLGFPFPTSLTPNYSLINQTSLDVQGATGSWLWKLEAMMRSGQGPRFGAVVAGFEYTFYGVLESGADVGLLMEYLYDGRARGYSTPPTPFNQDMYVGTRLALNDEQDTQLLVGATVDLETQATMFNIKGSRRLGEKWRLEVESRVFFNIPDSDILAGMRHDDYVQLRIARFF